MIICILSVCLNCCGIVERCCDNLYSVCLPELLWNSWGMFIFCTLSVSLNCCESETDKGCLFFVLCVSAWIAVEQLRDAMIFCTLSQCLSAWIAVEQLRDAVIFCTLSQCLSAWNAVEQLRDVVMCALSGSQGGDGPPRDDQASGPAVEQPLAGWEKGAVPYLLSNTGLLVAEGKKPKQNKVKLTQNHFWNHYH